MDGCDVTGADHRPERASGAAGAPHVTGAPTRQGAAGIDPLTAPLTYPGTPPWRPAVLVTDAAVLALQPRNNAPIGQWLLQACVAVDDGARNDRGAAAGGVPLDRYLRNAGGSPAGARIPVLAVGSNASPAQVRRKLANAGLPTLVPVIAVSVRGLAAGVSAHVSRPGYLPATPVPEAGAVSELWVVWLDPPALTAIDATEPNYHRIRVPARYPVRLTTGQPVPECWVYLSRHGHLVNEAGEPRRLTDQATLITGLLAEIPALQTLTGVTPREWLERTRDAEVRDAVREVFRTARVVHRTGGL
jgi:hypothetical protein